MAEFLGRICSGLLKYREFPKAKLIGTIMLSEWHGESGQFPLEKNGIKKSLEVWFQEMVANPDSPTLYMEA